MPNISSSPWILGTRHNGWAAAICSINRRSSAAVPESAEPFALPVDDRVGLDVDQRTSPVGSHAAESDPKSPLQGRQQRALPFSLKRGYLHA
jgi:hypothetical protein